jgi:lauroyl/myristoyl acyltransferase
MLIDHADYYLSLSRSDRWMARHLLVRGAWPDPSQPAILCTFHWGAGMWGLRHAAAHAMRAHAIAAPQLATAFPGRKVKFLYARARVRAVGTALRTEPIEPSRSPRRILRALHHGEQVLAAIDVPADQVTASESIDFLGLRARVPRGLLRVACDAGMPVTVYLLGIRLSDGKRTLQIHNLGLRRELESLISEVFSYLEAAITEEPAAWHFWSVAPRFFERADGSAGTI